MQRTHFVKVRKTGDKAWAFLASGGRINRLRIYALQYTEADAKMIANDVPTLNPGYEAKIVLIEQAGRK